MAEDMEKITVTLPKDKVAALRRARDAGEIPSVSAYVAESVQRRMEVDAWRRQWTLLNGDPTPEHIRWANDTISRYFPAAGERQAS